MSFPSRPWTWRLGLGVLLAGYLGWLGPAIAPYAGSSDASGYMWSARLFRHGTLSVPVDVPQRFPLDVVGLSVFVPLGARMSARTRALVPTYPTGLPLHIAAATLLLGEEAAVKAVLLVAVGAALCLLYVLGREAGLERRWALAACVLLAGSPLFLFVAVQPLSDLLATVWAEAAILCAWRARERRLCAAMAGASLGIATLVRPTDAVLLLPVLTAMPLAIRHYALLTVGALPFAAFVAVYQAWAYGHPLSSGYGNVSSAFAWANIGPSLTHYFRWLPRLGSWLIVLAPTAAWAWRGALARWRVVAGTWVLVVFGTYAVYLLTSETWWYMRFVLPAFPPLILASLAGLQEITRAAARQVPTGRLARAAGLSALAVAALCVAVLVRSPQHDAFRAVKEDERVYPDALKVVALESPPGTPVLMVQMTGAANYYAPHLRFLRYDALSPDAWRALRQWQSLTHAAIGAALFPFERDELFRDGGTPLPCNWQSRGHYRHVTFWECPP
jgi:hypothetical protein